MSACVCDAWPDGPHYHLGAIRDDGSYPFEAPRVPEPPSDEDDLGTGARVVGIEVGE